MNWGLLTTEFVICAWILIMLIADLVIPEKRKSLLSPLALAGIVVCLVILIQQAGASLFGYFQSSFVVDRFAVYFKGLFLITTAIVIIMIRKFSHHLPSNLGAFYMLLFTALLGMCVLASVNDLLLLFVGLELVTFSMYVMAAYLKSDKRAIEAGMKYLILGSVSAGFLVYGLSLVYGFAGSTSFAVVQTAFSQGTSFSAQAGMLMILAGLGFKIAMVPFHLWVPDVYEGAPTPVVAMLSVGSKMAGVVALLRVLSTAFLPLSAVWMTLLAILSAATMLYGNLGAIPQTNIKRMLGYSSIGHAGYLLMGLSNSSIAGNEAVSYYLLAYLFSNLAVFLVVVVASDEIGGDSIESYNGLAKRSPFLAATLFIGLLSLAGVPPLAGFIGKFLVLLATTEGGRLGLVFIGAVNVVISLYYYLMVVRRMYLFEPSTKKSITVDRFTRTALYFLLAGIFAIGIFQGPFLEQISLLFR